MGGFELLVHVGPLRIVLLKKSFVGVALVVFLPLLATRLPIFVLFFLLTVTQISIRNFLNMKIKSDVVLKWDFLESRWQRSYPRESD